MDCHDSKLNGTVFGTHDWPYHLRGQAAVYRKLAEQTDDPTVKDELLELASVFPFGSPVALLFRRGQ